MAKNSAIRKAEQDGYQYTGCVSRGSWDKDKVEARVAEYKVMGNKVKVLLKRDETQFRGRTETHAYWVLYVKYSPEYLAFKQAEREQREIARRQLALSRMADECTLEEIQWMLNHKIASLVVQNGIDPS